MEGQGLQFATGRTVGVCCLLEKTLKFGNENQGSIRIWTLDVRFSGRDGLPSWEVTRVRSGFSFYGVRNAESGVKEVKVVRHGTNSKRRVTLTGCLCLLSRPRGRGPTSGGGLRSFLVSLRSRDGVCNGLFFTDGVGPLPGLRLRHEAVPQGHGRYVSPHVGRGIEVPGQGPAGSTQGGSGTGCRFHRLQKGPDGGRGRGLTGWHRDLTFIGRWNVGVEGHPQERTGQVFAGVIRTWYGLRRRDLSPRPVVFGGSCLGPGSGVCPTRRTGRETRADDRLGDWVSLPGWTRQGFPADVLSRREA